MGEFAIKKVREAAGLTQTALAEKIGVPVRTLGSWERGEREIDLADAWKIADAMNVRLDDIAGRVEYSIISPDTDDPEDTDQADDSKERLDRAYELLNDDSRKLLADLAESIACDSSRLR